MAKKETNKKENTKNKRSFSKDFKAELKKVIWLTPKQLVNNTVAVVTIVIITAIIVFVLDIAFEAINKQGINKVKEVISSSNSISVEDSTTDDAEESTDLENATTDEGEVDVTEENTSEDNVENNTENNNE